jgi:GNAT superfamily N-acetyltransferase
VIRRYEAADADAAAAILAAGTPWLWTAAGLRHRPATVPTRARHASWVATTTANEIAGWAESEFDWTAERDDVGRLYVYVAPAHRSQGLGSSLFERTVGHLLERGARELRTWSLPESDGFPERRGFARTRLERLSAVDPRTVDTSPLDSLPGGVRVTALTSLEDRLPEVHAVFAEAAADMPADHAESRIPFDEWLAETIGDPDLTHEGSFVTLVDDRPAALSFLKVDAVRRLAEQELTGTARAYRRRGLARVAKLAVLRWAAAQGYTRVSTGNDETNAGMLLLNVGLGFRPFAVETEWVKPVT